MVDWLCDFLRTHHLSTDTHQQTGEHSPEADFHTPLSCYPHHQFGDGVAGHVWRKDSQEAPESILGDDRRFLKVVVCVHEDSAENALQDIADRLGRIVLPAAVDDLLLRRLFQNRHVLADCHAQLDVVDQQGSMQA